MSNPLVAERQDSTQAFTGVPLLESANDTAQAINSGDWASGVMGAAGTALDAIGMAMDPFGSIFAAGVGWLIEHVGPLSDALDELTGDPDQIAANAQTWTNISQELSTISADLAAAVQADTSSWAGDSADAYRGQSTDLANLIAAARTSADGTANGISTAGEVVGAVRTLVRDIIAELVGHLISWALQVVFTLGIGLAWVVPQVVAAVAKTATKIAKITTGLVQAMGKLGKLLAKLGKNFGDVSGALKKINSGRVDTPAARPGSGPTSTAGFHGPSGSSGGSGLPGSSGGGTPGGGPSFNSFLGGGKFGKGGGGGGTSRGLPGSGTSTSGTGVKPYEPPKPLPVKPQPDWDGPFSPAQPPSGSGPAIPNSAHNHVTFGDVKPGWGKKPKPSFSGGHVMDSDINVPKPPPGGGHTPAAGVTGHGPNGSIGAPQPNGIYEIHKPTSADGAGNPLPKPMSTMFPQGLPASTTQGLGNQAWNYGAPNGGIHPPAPGSKPNANNTWHGQAQIPYTPVYGGPHHGSGAFNHPNAGDVINISGYSSPPGPGGVGGNIPQTYYPNGTVTTPPKQPDHGFWTPDGWSSP
jgi:uncharacterized protein YukE